MKRLIALVLCLFAQPAAAEGLLWDFKLYQPLLAVMAKGQEAPIYTKETPDTVMTRFVIQGSGEDDWIEAFEIYNTKPKNEPKSAKLWYEKFQAAVPAGCAGDLTLIEESAKSITFEHRTPDCPPAARSAALHRVMYGKHNVFLLSATIKGEMSEDTHKSLLAMLASAQIGN